jgi:hypothetical protein
MPGSTDNGGPYQVHASGLIAAALKQIQDQANKEGRGEKVLAAIRQIRQRLSLDPMSAGEQLYRLPAMRMQIRCILVPPLAVHFGVCEDRPFVFLKGVLLLPEPPS